MFRNLMARLKATPPWVWITVAIAAIGVVISFLIYRQNASTPAADTSGQASNVNPGDTSGGYSPYGNNSSQYQPDYSTQSLLEQMVNLLKGLQPGATPPPGPGPTPGPTPGPSPVPGTKPPVLPPSPSPSPSPRPTPIGGRKPPVRPPSPAPIGGTMPPVHAPPVPPHPIGPAQHSPVPLRQQPDVVIGSVAHADGHAGTFSHPGAVSVGNTPHPLQQRQMGF